MTTQETIPGFFPTRIDANDGAVASSARLNVAKARDGTRLFDIAQGNGVGGNYRNGSTPDGTSGDGGRNLLGPVQIGIAEELPTHVGARAITARNAQIGGDNLGAKLLIEGSPKTNFLYVGDRWKVDFYALFAGSQGLADGRSGLFGHLFIEPTVVQLGHAFAAIDEGDKSMAQAEEEAKDQAKGGCCRVRHLGRLVWHSNEDTI